MISIRRFLSTSSIRTQQFGFGSVNRVMLVGNVGNAVDVRSSPVTSSASAASADDKSSVRHWATFSLATSETQRSSSGEYEKITQWHRVLVVGSNQAEMAGRFIHPGSKVYVEGKLQYREWEKEGQKRLSTEIVVGRDGQLVVLSKGDGAKSADETPVESSGRGLKSSASESGRGR